MYEPEVSIETIAGPETGRRFTFTSHDTFLFGRSKSCHVSIPSDAFLSQHHFLVEVNPPHARIRDCGSLNGTLVNDTLLGGKGAAGGANELIMDVRDGDRIQAGKSIFSVSIRDTRPGVPTEPMESTAAPDAREPLSALTWDPDHGPYVIEEEIGRGGMGVVHRGRDRRSGAPVALKTIIPGAQLTAQRMGLLVREVQSLRTFEHPHIVKLLGIYRKEREIVIAMEYCNLGSASYMASRRKAPLPYPVALAILAHALNGLTAVHRKGFVHRDLKPANILLNGTRRKWRACLGDFGLAKSFDLAGLSGFTATGKFSGTLDYMPCEQISNYKYVHPSSDVWSMACAYYWLVTRRLPREPRANEDAVNCVLRNEIVPLRDRRSETPAAVCEVIDRALLPEPADRYPSAVEFRSALRRAASEVRVDAE